MTTKYYCKACGVEINEYTYSSNRGMCCRCSQYAYYKENDEIKKENDKIKKENDEIKTVEAEHPKITEEEMIQKIYEVMKLVDCLQYNPYVNFNYLRAKSAYNIIKNQIEHIEAKNEQFKQTLSKKETVEKELRERLEKAVELPTIYEHTIYPFIENLYTETIYYVVYKENGKIIAINCGKNKQHAETRLAELKGK